MSGTVETPSLVSPSASLNATAEIIKVLKFRDLFDDEQILSYCTDVKEDTFLHADGVLVLTKLQLLFVCIEERFVFPIPLGHIIKLDLPGLRKGSAGKYLPSFVDAYLNGNSEGNYLETDEEIRISVKCIDFKSVDFVLQKKCNERKPFLQSLKASIQWDDITGTYMVVMPQISEVENRFLDPRTVYNPLKEYRRLGLDEMSSNGVWRVSDVNQNYEVCDTYPAFVCVPNSISDSVLSKAAEHRSRGRFVATVWKHPTTGATISRCSQPRVGLTGARNHLDEEFIHAVGGCHPKGNSFVYIVDCRPKLNAKANSAIGGGHENSEHYQNVAVEFANVENIHEIRESWNQLRRLVATCNGASSGSWWAGLAATKWLDHISSILTAARRVADITQRIGSSCVIHCSDGWDRTTQIASLAEIMLDPFYRTFRGFATLIEKEWISFGHQFATRHGLFTGSDKNQRAPIFLQFIDCVWQLMRQFPNEFEFTEIFLVYLLDHTTAMLFSTFTFDNEKAMKRWLADTCSNPEYKRGAPAEALSPSILPFDIVLWRSYYLRWISSANLNLPLLGTGGVRGWYCGQMALHEEIQTLMAHSRRFTGVPQPLLFPFGTPAIPSPVPTESIPPREPDPVSISPFLFGPDIEQQSASYLHTAPAAPELRQLGEIQPIPISRAKSENGVTVARGELNVRILARSEPAVQRPLPTPPIGRQFETHASTVQQFVTPFGHTPIQSSVPVPRLPPPQARFAPQQLKELARNASVPNFGAGHHRSKPV